MHNPKLPTVLVIGHAEHGKTTIAQMLAQVMNCELIDSSQFAAERVMMPAFAALGTPYETAAQCWADRSNYRAFWYTKIREYNTPDGARLARELLERSNIYVGMRHAEEYAVCIDVKLFDKVIWVEAGLRKPPESAESMSIEYNPMTMDLFDNNLFGNMKEHRERLHTTKRLQELVTGWGWKTHLN